MECGEKKFLFDEMLGRLARWCRLFGIDSLYLKGKSDSELLDIAEETGRVFVTRDSELCSRCLSRDIICIFIRSNDIAEQVAQVVVKGEAHMTFPEKMRCTACNSIIKKTSVERIRQLIPADVFENCCNAWFCPGCGKAYWVGGHWKNIMRMHECVMNAIKASG
jgi:hypothetical protein